MTTAASALVLGTLTLATPTALGVADGGDRNVQRHSRSGTVQVVKVHAPSPAARGRVAALGLDVTESADAAGIDVVLHGQKDADVLRRAGLTWTVKVKDLAALNRANAAKDRAYAAQVTSSPLPSGQDHYRTLADYNRELRHLAAVHPHRVRLIRLKHRSLEGRVVLGIEVSRQVRRTNDGKPVFLMHGRPPRAGVAERRAHHGVRLRPARERGHDARATRIVDGRGRSSCRSSTSTASPSPAPRAARRLLDLRLRDEAQELRVSVATPAQYTGGTCDDNPAGRLRGTDLNRNYPGFWGGPGREPGLVRRHLPRRRPRGRARGGQRPQLISDAPGHQPDHQPHVQQPGAAAAVAASTGLAPDEPQYKALGASMTDANGYANWASFQLYDTSGSVEDW